MANINLSSAIGVSGEFISKFASAGIQINSGTGPILATLTPPAGQRVRLNFLAANSNQNNITVNVGGSNIISSKTLKTDLNATSNNLFSIGGGSGTISHIDGKTDEVIVFSVIGTLSIAITYAYQFGE